MKHRLQYRSSRNNRRDYPETASATDKRRWLVDQLRAMGVPNKILARVVWADLDKGWTRHANEVALEYHGDPDAMAALQLETDKSKDAEMRAASGRGGLQAVGSGKYAAGSQPRQNPSDLRRNRSGLWLLEKRQQRQLDLEQAKMDGTMDPADVNDAKKRPSFRICPTNEGHVGRRALREIAANGRCLAAAGLRQDLAKANPSDSQFQALLKTQQQWNEQRSALDKQFQNDPTSTAYADQIKALDAARDQEYRRVLGDDAFDALQKEQDPGYTQMKKYETLWNLDDKSIDSVYGAH